NNKYSPTFKIPEGLIQKETGKIYSLKNPEVKMSKSDTDQNAYILMLDDRDTIIRKVKKEVKDSLGEFRYRDEKKDLQNNKNKYIIMINDSVIIIRKVKKAVTDSLGEFKYSDEQKALQNLINIYRAFTGESIEDIVKRYENLNYATFKEDLGFVVADGLKPIQDKFNDLMSDKKYLEEVMKNGADKADYLANKTLRKVYKKVGLIQRP